MPSLHDGHAFLGSLCIDCLHDRYFAMKARIAELERRLREKEEPDA